MANTHLCRLDSSYNSETLACFITHEIIIAQPEYRHIYLPWLIHSVLSPNTAALGVQGAEPAQFRRTGQMKPVKFIYISKLNLGWPIICMLTGRNW